MTVKPRNISPAICRQLSRCGTKFLPYARSPVNNANFIASAFRNDTVRIWATEVAEFRMDRSEEHKQALLSVHEPERKLVRTRNWRPYDCGLSEWACRRILQRAGNDKSIVEQARRVITDRVGYVTPLGYLNIPDQPVNITHEILIPNKNLLRLVKCRAEKGKSPTNSVPVRYTRELKETKMSLLLGTDEVATFICAVPDEPTTVEEAHKALRPKAVPEGSLRQGEWFFVPMSNYWQQKLNEYQNTFGTSASTLTTPRALPLERDSSHHADHMLWAPKNLGSKKIMHENPIPWSDWRYRMFVRGGISDTRKGRHASLFLEKWHEVHRNREITVPEHFTERPKYWD